MEDGSFGWRDGVRRDRPLLQGFTCTTEHPVDLQGRKLSHPRPWELEVQTWIRTQTPPAGHYEALRLDVSEPQLRAVGALAIADIRDRIVIVKIQAVAISVDCRGSGGNVADGTVEDVMRSAATLVSTAGGVRTILVAWVDVRNEASKRLLARSGFEWRQNLDGFLEEWIVEVEASEGASQ